MFTVTGEYSIVPELSPIGKVNDPVVLTSLRTTPPPDAMIIRLADGEATEIDPDNPMVSVFVPRLRFPFDSVKTFATLAEPPKVAVPED